LDRLSRSVLGCASLLQELRNFSVGLVIVTALELGHNAHDGFILNILASFAEFEREMIAGRIAESRARLKARGLRIAGAVPFGFRTDPRTKQLVPVEPEAVIVRWMFEYAAAGETPASIAAAANAEGWKTKVRIGRRTGKQHGGIIWTARQVIATLRNPVYLGQFREKQGVRFGKHDPIVASDVFAAAAAQLEARRTRTPGKRYEIAWPLKGRIICAVCGRPMSPHTIRYRNVLYRYYRCRSTAGGRVPCGHQVSAHAIETAVEGKVSRQLGQESQLWDSIELVTYDHRDEGIRVRLIPPVYGEQEHDT
jgi:site-specific DNA recombinase